MQNLKLFSRFSVILLHSRRLLNIKDPRLRAYWARAYAPHSARQHPNVRCMAGSTGSTKVKHVYKCKNCGEEALQWSGSCRSCRSFNTMEKVSLMPEPEVGKGGGGGGARAAARVVSGKQLGSGGPSLAAIYASSSAPSSRGWVDLSEGPQRLSDITKRSFRLSRLQLPGENGQELARVLGGGVVPGSLTLVGGDPGVGKSTLLLQMSQMLTEALLPGGRPGGVAGVVQGEAAGTGAGGEEEEEEEEQQRPVLYVSGEESKEQIGGRAERMGIGKNPNIIVDSENRMELILERMITLRPKAVVVDSINTVYLEEVTSSAGGVVQMRECASALMKVGKREKIPVFLVGHVTKEGDIAGPKVLEHLVDTVVQMEGGRQSPIRMVRCLKNRFGNTDEVGLFSMNEEGLAVVPDPSQLFLSSRTDSSGVSSAVTVLLEGSRPLLVEVQALCSKIPEGAGVPPGRLYNGIDFKRLQLVLGVLNKHTDMRPYSSDVYVNVLGGLSMQEPSSDLAIAVAIASSYYDQTVARDVAVLGEIGLGGEIRSVPQLERRLLEARKLGFNKFIVPAGSGVEARGKLKGAGIVECRRVGEAFRAALGT